MNDLDRAHHFARSLRMIVVAAARGAALVYLFRGLSTLVGGAFWYMERRPLLKAGMMPSSEAYEWLYEGAEQLLPAVLLALFSSALAQWLVPAPRAACLRCGYSTEKLTKPVCPECGSPVPLDRPEGD